MKPVTCGASGIACTGAVVLDAPRARVDRQAADEPLAAVVVALLAAGPGEGEEARHVELAAVARHGEAARLEVLGPGGIAAAPGAHVHVADDALAGHVDDRDRVLRGVGDERALAVGRDDDVPRLGAGRQAPHDAGAEPRRAAVEDADDGDGAGGRVGDERPPVVVAQRHALGLVAGGDAADLGVRVGADDRHRVGIRVDRPDEAAVVGDRDRARVRGGLETEARRGGGERRGRRRRARGRASPGTSS